jgi:recombination protein RecA
MKFQGIQSLIDFLHENDVIARELEAKVRGVEVELPEGERVDEEGY